MMFPRIIEVQQRFQALKTEDYVSAIRDELRKKEFTTKAESVSRKRKGKREYLNGSQTRRLMKQLNAFFETIVEVPRMRIGKRQTVETLINEEALLFAKFLRDERKTWTPKITALSPSTAGAGGIRLEDR